MWLKALLDANSSSVAVALPVAMWFCLVSCSDAALTWVHDAPVSVLWRKERKSDKLVGASRFLCQVWGHRFVHGERANPAFAWGYYSWKHAHNQSHACFQEWERCPCGQVQLGCKDGIVSFEQHFLTDAASAAARHTQRPIDTTFTTRLQSVAQSPARLSDNEEMITMSLMTC